MTPTSPESQEKSLREIDIFKIEKLRLFKSFRQDHLAIAFVNERHPYAPLRKNKFTLWETSFQLWRDGKLYPILELAYLKVRQAYQNGVMKRPNGFSFRPITPAYDEGGKTLGKEGDMLESVPISLPNDPRALLFEQQTDELSGLWEIVSQSPDSPGVDALVVPFCEFIKDISLTVWRASFAAKEGPALICTKPKQVDAYALLDSFAAFHAVSETMGILPARLDDNLNLN